MPAVFDPARGRCHRASGNCRPHTLSVPVQMMGVARCAHGECPRNRCTMRIQTRTIQATGRLPSTQVIVNSRTVFRERRQGRKSAAARSHAGGILTARARRIASLFISARPDDNCAVRAGFFFRSSITSDDRGPDASGIFVLSAYDLRVLLNNAFIIRTLYQCRHRPGAPLFVEGFGCSRLVDADG